MTTTKYKFNYYIKEHPELNNSTFTVGLAENYSDAKEKFYQFINFVYGEDCTLEFVCAVITNDQ